MVERTQTRSGHGCSTAVGAYSPERSSSASEDRHVNCRSRRNDGSGHAGSERYPTCRWTRFRFRRATCRNPGPMTSFRQIEANRRNALKSSGPKSLNGKHTSRRNALRHGLTAETVIEGLEDTEDYRGFEAAIIADYDAQTAVERELVLRLASLLWRLRRIISIETDLLQIQAEIRRARLDEIERASEPRVINDVAPSRSEVRLDRKRYELPRAPAATIGS